MDAKTWGAVLGLALTIGGGALFLEDRFIQRAQAEERHAELYKELQLKDLKTKLELAELELRYASDEVEREKIERRIDVLQKAILDLEGDY